MKHKHHIKPRHMGGGDDPENLVELTISEHAAWHYELWAYYGKQDDYVAWKCLSGALTNEEVNEELWKLGRIKAGETNKLSGHMSRVGKILSKEERQVFGLQGAMVCKNKGINAFFDPNLRSNIAKLGGATQGKINAKSGHCAKITHLSSKNKGMHWITNGIISKMILNEEKMPDGFRFGRIYTNKTN